MSQECAAKCPGWENCQDVCARPEGHDGLHLSADGVCAWTRDGSWFGPGGSEEAKEAELRERD